MAAENDTEAMTGEELSGNAQPASSSASSDPPRNTFTTLMASKRKASPSFSPSKSKKPHSSNPVFDRRSGLGVYIANPEKFDPSVIVFHNKDFVAIHDLYPKSSVHCLLLPRNPKYQFEHPFDALEDPAFLSSIRTEAGRLKSIVAAELRRKYGRFSKLDAPRQDVLYGRTELKEGERLPAGRDWEKEVVVGVHAVPSMHHLHIHVLSKDRYSEALKHRKHYNSFATGFFVELEAFPLAEGDVRRHPGKEGYLKADMKCWRCGENFGNKFARLKEHLKVEFEEWKKE